MVVNFFNQNPCIPSEPGVFQFDFFSVILGKSMSISAFGLSSSLSNSFTMLLIHSAFLLCSLGCHILLQNCSASLAYGCLYVFVSSPHNFQRFSFLLSFLSVFVAFFSAFPVEFPIQVLLFCWCSLMKPIFSHKLILLLHELVHLIRLCFLLVYMLIRDLFFRFHLDCSPFYVS